MHKNVYPIIVIIMLFLAGLIALTQESDSFNPVPGSRQAPAIDVDLDDQWPAPEEDYSGSGIFANVPEWVMPARWFRSNAGGMALEEIPSRITALRYEYALVIDFVNREELPEYLTEYYRNNFFIEIRALYEKGEEKRRQWIFKDNRGITRLIAAFSDPENDDGGKTNRNGFIELFNENGFITSEYRFFDDGKVNRNDYNYSGGLIISSSALERDENAEEGEFTLSHIDNYRYNRSSFLRSVERVFYKEMQISSSDDSIMLSFPGNIMSAATVENFISEKINPHPEFFGEVSVLKESRIVFTTDERGRVLTEEFHDGENNIIWIIRNTWQDDRIVSAVKTEEGIEYLAEYEYDSEGKRILERNLRNGILERLVRSEGGRDTEFLYINNIVVLQAVWEDGRKISETRVR